MSRGSAIKKNIYNRGEGKENTTILLLLQYYTIGGRRALVQQFCAPFHSSEYYILVVVRVSSWSAVCAASVRSPPAMASRGLSLSLRSLSCITYFRFSFKTVPPRQRRLDIYTSRSQVLKSLLREEIKAINLFIYLFFF